MGCKHISGVYAYWWGVGILVGCRSICGGRGILEGYRHIGEVEAYWWGVGILVR